jgi:hypothetical protein
MEAIRNLFGEHVKSPAKERKYERGELLKEFLRNILPSWDAKRYGKMTIPRLARKLQGIPTKDLYYIDRVCKDSKNYSKRFFWEIDPKKHQQDRYANQTKKDAA